MFLSKAYKIHINGIVQGVGFRPFVYRLALELKIAGWVNNSSDGVDIHAEGENVDIFYQKLVDERPALAHILTIEKKEISRKNYQDFQIIESQLSEKKDVLVSPDVATCNDCREEMFDQNNRRYLYPFINCTNCGPRYSIIMDRPYDRNKTTMKTFNMCGQCQEEYVTPQDRRFHAQPIACEECGPKLSLLDSNGRKVEDHGIGIDLLEQGAIMAVKGLGGFHLVCDANHTHTVSKLRKIKERGAKPFALMARNLATASKIVQMTKLEEEILQSFSAPIVLLPVNKGIGNVIAPDVAPGLHTLGIMLPYTPVHHLLFQGKFDFLVMTSANLSGRPLIYQNDVAIEDLKEIADYFLIHDRDIYHPCDDSVVQVIGGKITFNRRARGYVPFPIVFKEKFKAPMAGLGGEMKNAFCLASENLAYMSQYIGDMHGLENFERFKQEYYSYQKVVNVSPERIAYDLHPDYATTKMAKTINCPGYMIQHHHAHHVSVMGEYELNSPMLGLICDGTGYGEDGKIWGFEYIYGDAKGYQRKGHLEYLPLPGGDMGAKYPQRIAYAYLKKTMSEEEFCLTEPIWTNISNQEKNILNSQLKSGFQLFDTSSAGRLFDAVSGILNVCTKVTYEGQAAIELESRATVWARDANDSRTENILKSAGLRLEKTLDLINNAQECCNNKEVYPEIIKKYNLKENDNLVKNDNNVKGYEEVQIAKVFQGIYPIWLDASDDIIKIKIDLLLKNIVKDYLSFRNTGEIAYIFHCSLAVMMLECALLFGIEGKKIIIGGGVFQNKLLTEILISLAKEVDIEILYPTKLPAGDGGLALGQVLIANELEE